MSLTTDQITPAQLAAVEAAMQQMPASCREALLLRRAGRTIDEIAGQLNVSRDFAADLIVNALLYCDKALRATDTTGA